MDARRYVLASLMSVAVLAVAGCGGGQSSQDSPQASSSSTAIASLIDARWMGFDTNQPWNWQEIQRSISPAYQRFGFRPVGETRTPHHCEGCGENAPTAEVTVYAPGAYDPSGARTGEPVDVNGCSGFFGVPQRDHPVTDPNYPILDPSEVFDSVLLVWEYEDNAWATVRGMSPMAGDLDRLLELARAVRPDERAPVRVPLSIGFMPARMPLVGVTTDLMSVYGPEHGDIGTTLFFGPCSSDVKGDECARHSQETGGLGVEILQRDDYPESGVLHTVDRRINGRDGKSDPEYFWAAIQVQRGVYVEFNLYPQRVPVRTQETDDAARKDLDKVLDDIAWASDPADESTWQSITDWAK